MPENDNAVGKIIAKAWSDPAFKAELIANPAAALKAEGFDVPAGVAVTVLENTDKQFHLVLPPVPTDGLSEQELDAVAGGGGRGAAHGVQTSPHQSGMMNSYTHKGNAGNPGGPIGGWGVITSWFR